MHKMHCEWKANTQKAKWIFGPTSKFLSVNGCQCVVTNVKGEVSSASLLSPHRIKGKQQTYRRRAI